MRLEHSGWSEERGWFCDKYSIDTARTDYEIHWKDGVVCKQLTPFEVVEADWNCDGDVYEELGANFESKYSGRAWYSTHALLSLVLDGEAIIPGINKI